MKGSRNENSTPFRSERLASRLVRQLDRGQLTETTVLIGTALIVGIGSGFGAILFRWMIASFQYLAFEGGKQLLGFLGRYYITLIPALGGLIVGPLIYCFAREAKGHGVPEVMEAVALRGGRIRPIVAIIKSLASSICIGTGGSLGREGPIAQIGSALGSTVGQLLHLSDERIKNLVACGAAGGIAATFNAPIAGALFASEVILGEFTATYFSSVVISSVTASVISRIFLGNSPAFKVPPYSMVSPWELALYVILGVLASSVAVLFVITLYKAEDIFEAWKFPEYLKPAVGGLLIGLLGLYFPQIFGVGYEAIENALLDQIAILLLIALVFVKTLATSLTIGSGGSGGVFAPSLFIGSMLGGVFGKIVHTWLPSITASPGAYALVGMAAVFAGAARAPITSILILFEMTGDYRIILPLMLATVISTVLAERLYQESIYTLKLTRRGIRLQRGRDIDVMQGVLIKEAMTTEPDTVPWDMSLYELGQEFQRTHHHGFPVLDAEGKLHGVVTIQDLERALRRGKEANNFKVGDIATTSLLTAYPDEPLWAALKRLGVTDVGRLPVVDRRDPNKLLGMVRRSDIIRAYNLAIMRRQELQHRIDQLRLGRVTGVEFTEVEVGPDSPAAGKRIKELHVPEDCIIVSVRRNRQILIPHGDTHIETGDKVVVLAASESLPQVREELAEKGEG